MCDSQKSRNVRCTYVHSSFDKHVGQGRFLILRASRMRGCIGISCFALMLETILPPTHEPTTSWCGSRVLEHVSPATLALLYTNTHPLRQVAIKSTIKSTATTVLSVMVEAVYLLRQSLPVPGSRRLG